MLEFVFTDQGNQAVALDVRRGMAEFIPVPADYLRKSDYVLELDSETWAALYLSSTDVEKAVANGKLKLTRGDPKEAATVFGLFDKFVPTKNDRVPPLHD